MDKEEKVLFLEHGGLSSDLSYVQQKRTVILGGREKSTCHMKKKRREIKTISKWFKIHVSEGNENAGVRHYRQRN